MRKYAFMNVQCAANNGQVGTFLTNGHGKEDREPISPIFKDLVDLYEWMKQNGWKSDEYDGGNFIPWRVSKSLSN